MLNTNAITVTTWQVVEAPVFCLLRIRHIGQHNIEPTVMHFTLFIGIGSSTVNRVGKTVFHLNVAVTVTSQDHIHFRNASGICDFVAINGALSQLF